MSNWIDKLARLPHNQDGSLIDGAVEPVLRSPSSQPGIWYETPYDFVPDFDLLWVCQQHLDKKLFAFTAAQAAASPASAPHITLTLPDVGPADGHVHNVSAFGFAPNGDIWVGYYDNDPVSASPGQYVAKLSAYKLSLTASVTPDFSFPIGAAGISSLGVSAILITLAGDMWVSTVASGAPLQSGILLYPAASIAAPGAPSPTVVLRQSGALNSANDLRLDPAGNLWFCNALAGTVNRLSASQLLSSDSAIVPDIVLTVGAYQGVTLDSLGNLWCARSGAVDMFAAADVLASGSPAPARTITTPSPVPGLPKLRFDRAGDLWVNTSTGPAGYPPADLVASGTPPHGAILTGAGALTAPRVINFNPASFA